MSEQEDTETSHWKDQDECQDCGVTKDDAALRAIKLLSGGRDLLCIECFVDALDAGRVSADDPRVRDDGRARLGRPRAPGQDGGSDV